MYKNLYDNFAHWFHNDRGTVYFYSDPHFNDDEMKSLRKNYIGDEEQIKRINSKIGKYDTLVILGDIGDIEWIRKIRGYKVLILGNHDRGATTYKRDFLKIHTPDHAKLPIKVDNRLFDEVYEGCLMISDKIILSHEPVDLPYAFNIHGHVHGEYTGDNMHFNVCAEHINYTPVCLKDILNSGYLKNVLNIHRECIDKAIERKQKRSRV